MYVFMKKDGRLKNWFLYNFTLNDTYLPSSVMQYSVIKCFNKIPQILKHFAVQYDFLIVNIL